MPIFNVQLLAQGKSPDGKTVNLAPQIALQQRGPVVPASVCLEINMAKPLLAQGKAIIGAPGVALIDTGATVSAIDEEIAKELKIPVVDQGKMGSASHESTPCNLYPVQITIGGVLVLQIPRAMGAKLKPMGLIAIIGRDILQQCTLFYNGGTGTISLSI
jgi:predicted aspartyl protease